MLFLYSVKKISFANARLYYSLPDKTSMEVGFCKPGSKSLTESRSDVIISSPKLTKYPYGE